MKYFLLVTMLLVSCAVAHAQGFVAGGLAYNGRENDTGYFIETGFDVKRVGLAVDFQKMVSDPFQYREVEFLARVNFARNIWAEAGFAVSAMCFAPDIPHSCEYHDTKRGRTPVLGVQWLAPTKRTFQPLLRFDFTRWQQPPTMLKDDGFRMLVGVRWPRHAGGGAE